MKKSFIMGIVWVAAIALVVSFGITVFFLDGSFTNKQKLNYEKEISTSKQMVYLSDESSIRTNTFADLNDIDLIGNVIVEKVENKIESGEAVESVTKVISFVKPIQGEVLKPLSINELIYSNTLNEWTTHNGIDYRGKIGQEVFSVNSGKIKEIGFNYIYGDYIVIEHEKDYESLYSNITVLDKLEVGKNVEKGQVIGYLAESFGFEVMDDTHLHFELKKDGEHAEIIL